MLISISLENKRSPKEYAWYKFTGVRSISIPKSDPGAEVETDDLFGIRSVGENYHLIFRDHPTLLFRVPARVGALILKRSEGWSGKVGRYAVSAGLGLQKPKAKPKDNKPFVPPKEDLPELDSGAKALTSRLKKIGVVGMSGLKFLMSQEPLPNEVIYYFDANTVYRALAKQKGLKVLPKSWGDEIEAMIEQIAPDLDIECATVRYHGELKHLLSVEK